MRPKDTVHTTHTIKILASAENVLDTSHSKMLQPLSMISPTCNTQSFRWEWELWFLCTAAWILCLHQPQLCAKPQTTEFTAWFSLCSSGSLYIRDCSADPVQIRYSSILSMQINLPCRKIFSVYSLLYQSQRPWILYVEINCIDFKFQRQELMYSNLFDKIACVQTWHRPSYM